MDLFIAPRAGIWCRSMSGWDAFRAACAAGREPDTLLPEPIPDLLPAREGRRAPFQVRLAIEAGAQACRENGVEPGDVMTVFASEMGDLQITDYMGRTLAAPAPMLSPTKFHNSVHNAASGYWSIGAANRLASSAVASLSMTFPAALLETATIAHCERATLLLIVNDIGAPAPLDAVTPNRQAFAAGVLLSSRQLAPDWLSLSVDCRAKSSPWPAPGAAWLGALAAGNDCARGLPLLEALAAGAPFRMTMPLGSSSSLALEARG